MASDFLQTGAARTRRSVLGFGLAGISATALWLAGGAPVLALTTDRARSLVDGLVGEINRTINSGKSQAAMYKEFERIFGKYADVPTIARTTLGPDARSASAAEMRAFTEAFQGYIGRKYGSRFREFIGGEVKVESARPLKSFHEVNAVALLRGQEPFALTFLVSDRSGQDKFFDMLVEGVSLLKAERTEIGAMLDRRRGDISAMTADLRTAG